MKPPADAGSPAPYCGNRGHRQRHGDALGANGWRSRCSMSEKRRSQIDGFRRGARVQLDFPPPTIISVRLSAIGILRGDIFPAATARGDMLPRSLMDAAHLDARLQRVTMSVRASSASCLRMTGQLLRSSPASGHETAVGSSNQDNIPAPQYLLPSTISCLLPGGLVS